MLKPNSFSQVNDLKPFMIILISKSSYILIYTTQEWGSVLFLKFLSELDFSQIPHHTCEQFDTKYSFLKMNMIK